MRLLKVDNTKVAHCFSFSFAWLQLLLSIELLTFLSHALVYEVIIGCFHFILLSSSFQLFYAFGFWMLPLFALSCLYKEVSHLFLLCAICVQLLLHFFSSSWWRPLSAFPTQAHKGFLIILHFLISNLVHQLVLVGKQSLT